MVLDEWSRGLQSNSNAAKPGVAELDAIVRGQEKQVPSSSDFRAGWLAVCGLSDHEIGLGDGKLL